MKLGRALVPLEIGFSGELLVATVDAARPHGGVRGFLWRGFILVLGPFPIGVFLVFGL